jgi:serine/threonine protein kinase
MGLANGYFSAVILHLFSLRASRKPSRSAYFRTLSNWQVAAGLAAVHKQKLVHRDIKPCNIMVSLGDGGAVTAKIIDLGLAKGLNEPLSEARISMSGVFAGTPEFASPEQFGGMGVDIWSDLYLLGVTLWEMLSGRALRSVRPLEGGYHTLRNSAAGAPVS